MIKIKSQQTVSFNEICKNVSKRIADPKNSGYERYVGLEHLDTQEPHILRWGSTKDVDSSMTVFKSGQILFGRRNWYLRRVAVADFDAICSADIYILEPIEGKIISKFLPIFMHTDQFFEKVMRFSAGSMSTRVKWSRLAGLKFQIPDIPFQKEFVQVMEKIDKSILNNQKILSFIPIYKSSILNEYLTKGIKHNKFKTVEDFFKNRFQIPGSWEYKKFSSIVEIDPKTEVNQEICPYVPMDAVNSEFGTIDYFEDRNSSDFSGLGKFKQDDVLFAAITPSTEHGKVAIVGNFTGQGIASTELMVFRTKSQSEILPKYLYYYLKTNRVREHAVSQMIGGTGRQRVPSYVFTKDLSIPLPTTDEQESIIMKLDQINTIQLQLKNNLTNLQTLRKSNVKYLLDSPQLKEKSIIVQ